MDFFSHREITPYCLAGLRYNPFAYLTFIYLYPFIRWLKISSIKECLSDLNLYEAVKSPGLVAQLKLKYFLMKSTHDDIIESKFTFNCLLEDIKGS